MIGVGIIVPVLPELLEELTGGSVANAAVIGEYLVFTYAFMQFVFLPVLGICPIGLAVDPFRSARF